MQESNTSAPGRVRDGNQTLARGLQVLLAIVDSGTGLSVQQVSQFLGVHRSIAYRILQTLVDFGLTARGRDGLYRPGSRLATLSGAYLPNLRGVAGPIMRALADRLQSTVSLFVEQADEAVAIAMVEPTTAGQHIAFHAGMSTPLSLGAAGYALLAYGPPQAGEPSQVALARATGYARSYGEIESGTYAVAAWIPVEGDGARACLNLITLRESIANQAGPDVRRAADEVARLMDPTR